MENTMINSQSAAAKNSAKTSFMFSVSTMFPFFGYNKKEITDELNKIDIVNFIERAIRECKAKAQFILEFGDERYTMFLHKDDRGYYITVSETSSKTVQRPVKEIKRHYFICSRLTRNNIDDIANYIYGIVADYFYGYGIYEAPALEEAPSLDQAPALEEGYSMRGLEYLAENVPVVPVDAIVEGVNDYFSDCYVLEKCCGGYYVCDFEKFADIVWEYYVWPSVYTMTDKALEAETRCSMEFNLRLRYMLEKGYFEWLEIDNGIVRSNVVVAA